MGKFYYNARVFSTPFFLVIFFVISTHEHVAC